MLRSFPFEVLRAKYRNNGRRDINRDVERDGKRRQNIFQSKFPRANPKRLYRDRERKDQGSILGPRAPGRGQPLSLSLAFSLPLAIPSAFRRLFPPDCRAAAAAALGRLKPKGTRSFSVERHADYFKRNSTTTRRIYIGRLLNIRLDGI